MPGLVQDLCSRKGRKLALHTLFLMLEVPREREIVLCCGRLKGLRLWCVNVVNEK